MNPLVSYGVRNLGRNPRRTGLTGASVALGCGGLVLTFGYVNRLDRYMEVAHAWALLNGHISIYKSPGYDTAHLTPARAAFDPAELARMDRVLDADPGVLRHVPVLVGSGLLSNACRTQPYEALGLDPQALRWIWTNPEVQAQTPELTALSKGEPLWAAPEAERPLLMTQGLAALLEKPAVLDPGATGDPAFIDCDAPDAQAAIRADPWAQLVGRTWDGDFSVQDAVVVGHFSTGFTEYESDAVRAPLSTLQTLAGTLNVSYEAVFLRGHDAAGLAVDRLGDALRREGLDVVVYPWWSPVISPNYSAVMPLLHVMRVFIMVVLSWVVALALANAMTLAVLERTRELGALRAVGYTPRALLLLLLGEAILLSGLSAGLGAGLALAVSALINHLNLRFSPPGIAGSLAFKLLPEPAHVAVSVTLVLSVCVLSVAVASRLQLRRKIIDLLAG